MAQLVASLQLKVTPSAAGLFLRAKGFAPQGDQELLEQALNFANESDTELFHGWAVQDEPYLKEWRARGGTDVPEHGSERERFAREPSWRSLADSRRTELRKELTESLRNRAASYRRFRAEHAKHLDEIFIKPSWYVGEDPKGVGLRRDDYWIFSWPAMLAYLMLLLHDERSGIPGLCCCQGPACQKFFFKTKTRGRPQKRYHNRDCMLAAHRKASTKRSRIARARRQ
jgi:hypothetical protein